MAQRVQHGWGAMVAVLMFAAVLPVGSVCGDAGATGPQLKAALRLEKLQFEIGEPIPATLELINRSDDIYAAQTSTEDTGALDGLNFVVTDTAGRAVTAPPAFPRTGNWIGSWQNVRRHDKYERRIFLNHWFLALSPGRYRVHAQYTPHTFTGGKIETWPALQTAAVEFEIVPPTATKFDVRFSRLAEQAEKGDVVAVDFLGFTGDPAAVPALTEALYADDPRVQRRAANALNYLYDQPTVLSNVLDSVRRRGPNTTAAEWLDARGAPRDLVLAICVAHADADDAVIRSGAIAGLRLTQSFADRKPKLRKVVRATLLAALTDRDARVRLEAVGAVTRCDDAELVAALARVAREDPTGRVRTEAAQCLNDLRCDAVVPHLRELLLSDYRLRPNFAEQLRLIGTPAARDVLREGLRSANAKVKLVCAGQLWLMRDEKGRRTLVEALRSGDADAQASVMQFLSEAGDPRSPAAQPGTELTARVWADWLEKQK